MRQQGRWRYALPYTAFAVAGLLATDTGHLNLPGVAFGLVDLVGLAFSSYAANHPHLSAAARRPWRFLTAVFLLLVAVTGGLVTAGGVTGTFSAGSLVAIAGRLAIFPVLLLGLLSFAATPLDRRGRWKLTTDVATAVGCGLMLIWFFLLGPALSSDLVVTPLTQFTTMAYPVGDLVLIVGVCTVLLRGGVATVRRPLTLLLLGALGYLGCDLLLTFQTVYRPGTHADDLLMVLPLTLLAAAAVEQCRVASRPAGAEKPRRQRSFNALPYVALAGGYAVLAYAAAGADLYPWAGLVAGAVVMTFGVAARQVIAMRENFDLVVTDTLTGLANRVRLRLALSRAADRVRRTEVPMAVLVIDLDGFKTVNDTHGHEVGDRMLTAFADLLRRNVRGTDTPARLGGDEFAVVLEAVKTAEDAVAVAERILADAAANPLTVDGRKIQIRVSIGIAISTLSPDGVDPGELMHRADLAMYLVKRRRTQGWQLYSPEAMAAEEDTFGLREDLGRAVAANQLQLLYQPIVALATGELVAVEALVRWQHPTRGLVSPLAFIPLAEETGVIHELGAWVLEESCRQVRRWQDRLPTGRSLHLSVNFSPLQLERDTLAAEVFDVLRRTGLNPRDLVMEVTESAMVNDRSAVPQLAALREEGVRVALDDFGTGYSSLRYLTRLPVDILKLDRCFVAELNGHPERSAVAEAVIRLGQILHLDTVAEGIEEPAQATELTLLGCRNAQGYHFARPLAPEAMDALVDGANRSWPSLPADPRPTAQLAG